MSNFLNNLNLNGYVVLCNFVSDEFIKLMYQAYKNDYKNPDIFYHGEDFPMEGDVYVPHSKDWYNEHKVFNKFNNYVINHFAQRHGIRLKPTYNMGRVYTEKTQGMTKHKDRLPCEISITLPISYDQATWPICVYDDNLQQHKIHLRVGDMLVYRGCDQLHSREDDNINSECIQHYFHYVNLESEVGSFYRYFGEEPGIWPGNLEKMVYNNDLPVIDENIKGKYLKSIGE